MLMHRLDFAEYIEAPDIQSKPVFASAAGAGPRLKPLCIRRNRTCYCHLPLLSYRMQDAKGGLALVPLLSILLPYTYSLSCLTGST